MTEPRTLTTLALLAAAGLAFSLTASDARSEDGAPEFELDTAHTSVVFAADHGGFSKTFGMFREFEGGFALGANPRFGFTVPVKSIFTNNKKRDQHLLSPDFFNAAEHPTITFKSTKVNVTDTGYEVTGDLTLHGVTKPVTLNFEKLKEGDFMGSYRVGFMVNFTLKRSDYGMDNMIGPVGDDVEMWISFEGTRKG